MIIAPFTKDNAKDILCHPFNYAGYIVTVDGMLLNNPNSTISIIASRLCSVWHHLPFIIFFYNIESIAPSIILRLKKLGAISGMCFRPTSNISSSSLNLALELAKKQIIEKGGDSQQS